MLYVSPLKALTYDVERNLRAPLAGIALAAERAGSPVPPIRVATRTGDTPQADRRDIVAPPARHPHHHARVAVPDAHVGGPGDARDRSST